jgi:hypothetical protein
MQTDLQAHGCSSRWRSTLATWAAFQSPPRERLRKTDNPISASVEYSARGEIAPEPFYAMDFVISDGDQKALAIDVFRRVFQFWRDLFEDVGFIEPRFVEGMPPGA